jgi:hypothetical protein
MGANHGAGLGPLLKLVCPARPPAPLIRTPARATARAHGVCAGRNVSAGRGCAISWRGGRPGWQPPVPHGDRDSEIQGPKRLGFRLRGRIKTIRIGAILAPGRSRGTRFQQLQTLRSLLQQLQALRSLLQQLQALRSLLQQLQALRSLLQQLQALPHGLRA